MARFGTLSGMPAEVLWQPPADVRERTRIGDYLAWLERERGRHFDDYDALWRWSVGDLEGFWSSVWDYFQVIAHAVEGAVAGFVYKTRMLASAVPARA